MDASAGIAIIGSGINSLVAAAELALAGKDVCLIERQDRLGGFIDSGERTLPGFVHDTFSSWHPLFVSGGAYEVLGQELHARGLEYCNTEGAVTASVAPGPGTGTSRVAIAHRDPALTASALQSPGDEAISARTRAPSSVPSGPNSGPSGRSCGSRSAPCGAENSKGPKPLCATPS